MRIGERVTVTKTETRNKRYVCDLCKGDIEDERGSFTHDERTLRYAEGKVFPEGDARTHHKLDVCGDCFHERLKPLIEREFGATFAEYDRDEYYDKVEDETRV